MCVSPSVVSDCDSMDCSPPVSSVHGILQARCWSGLPFPSPGGPFNPGIEPGSPTLQMDSLLSEPQGRVLTKCQAGQPSKSASTKDERRG